MKLKKFERKDRYGNMISMEFDTEGLEVPTMAQIPMVYDHPGDPKGTDTVPAWLTPGEFVVNKEATEIYGPIIEDMNDHGREIQDKKMHDGGTVEGGKYRPIHRNEGGSVPVPQPRPPYLAAKSIYDRLRDRGFSHNAAVGIVANFETESGFDPAKKQLNQKYANRYNDGNKNPNFGMKAADSWFPGQGYGLAQWTESRRDALKKFAKDSDRPMDDINTQLDFMMQEMGGEFKNVRDNLANAQSPEAATQYFLQDYEKAGKPASERRLAYAREFSDFLTSERGEDPVPQVPLPPMPEESTTPPPVNAESKSRPLTFLESLFGSIPMLKQQRNGSFIEYKQMGGDITDPTRLVTGARGMRSNIPEFNYGIQQAELYDRAVGDSADDLGTAPTGVPIASQVPPEVQEKPFVSTIMQDPNVERAVLRADSEVRKDTTDREDLGNVPTGVPIRYEPDAPLLDAVEKLKKQKQAEAKALLEKRQAESKLVPNLGGSGIVIQDIDDVIAAKEKNQQTASNNLVNAVESGDPALIAAAAEEVDEATTGTGAARITESGMTATADTAAAASAQAEVDKTKKKAEDLRDQAAAQAEAGNTTAAAALNSAADNEEAKIPELEAEAEAAADKAVVSNAEYDAEREQGATVVGSKPPSETSSSKPNKEVVKEKTIAEIIAQGNQHTGPAAEQPGDNSDANSVKTEGEKQDSKKKKQAESMFKSLFGDLFDAKELARMAVMYLGSRAMGYSHQGSMGFAAKNYITRVDTKAANRDKFIMDNATKFTTESLDLYKETGKLSDLIPVGTPIKRKGEYKTFYGPGGKKITGEKVTQGDNTYYVDQNGKIINQYKFNEDARNVPGTEEYESRVSSMSKDNVAIIKSMKTKMGEDRDGSTMYKTDINPEVEGRKVAEWAIANGVSLERVGGLVQLAMQDAINDERQDGSRAQSLIPYMNSLVIRERTQVPEMFMVGEGEDRQPVDAEQFMALNQDVATVMRTIGAQGSDFNLANQYYTQAIKEWNDSLTEEDRTQYARMAEGTGLSPFMVFVQKDLGDYLSKVQGVSVNPVQ